MIVSFKDGLYVADGFDVWGRKAYLFENGFKYNPELKKMVSETRPTNKFLYYWADDELFETTNYTFARCNPEPIEIDGALEHQKSGVPFLIKGKRVILADEQGLGKTFTCIRAFEMLGLKNILICCPLIAKGNWKDEILKFSVRYDINFITASNPATEGINICHYDVLLKQKESIDNIKFKLLICDEAHKIKNKKSDRSSAIYGKWENKKWQVKKINTEYAWFLSGTIITGNAYDLYPILSYLNKEKFDWKTFTARYSYQGKFGYDSYIGQNRLLRDDMAKLGIMLRREKKEVWKNMPPKNYIKYSTRISEFKLTKEQKLIIEESKYDLDEILSSGELDISKYSGIRKLTGILKIPSTIEIALDLLETNNKVLIGTVHRECTEEICRILNENRIKTEKIMGGSKDREQVIKNFQSGDTRVVVANIISAGTAINFYNINQTLFHEKEWNSSDNSQFEDRTHRIGQENPCYYHENYMEGTIDELIYNINSKKDELFKRIVATR